MTPPDRTRALVGAGVIGIVVVMMIWTTHEVQKPLPPIRSTPRHTAAEPALKADEAHKAPAPITSENQPSPSPSASGAQAEAARPPELTARPADLSAELEEVQGALRDYRAALGGNPVGTNAEITRALLGDNPKQLKLPVPAGSKLNPEGELCDPWGTPYFFHQVSGREMEVRSAGPDGRLWTADDRQM